MTEPPHTDECADLGALLDLVGEKIRVSRGRGEMWFHLRAAAEALCVAQSKAHRTCVTLDALFEARPS
jgi:hypothetical protein